MNIPETRGTVQVYNFSNIAKGESKFYPDAPDSIRRAAWNYGNRQRPKIKFACRTKRNEKKKRIGVTVYHI